MRDILLPLASAEDGSQPVWYLPNFKECFDSRWLWSNCTASEYPDIQLRTQIPAPEGSITSDVQCQFHICFPDVKPDLCPDDAWEGWLETWYGNVPTQENSRLGPTPVVWPRECKYYDLERSAIST